MVAWWRRGPEPLVRESTVRTTLMGCTSPSQPATVSNLLVRYSVGRPARDQPNGNPAPSQIFLSPTERYPHVAFRIEGPCSPPPQGPTPLIEATALAFEGTNEKPFNMLLHSCPFPPCPSLFASFPLSVVDNKFSGLRTCKSEIKLDLTKRVPQGHARALQGGTGGPLTPLQENFVK